MRNPKFQLITAFLAAVAVLCGSVQHAVAYTPKSPEVQKMVKKAVAYLETAPSKNKAWEDMMGVQMLVAYAIYKATKNPTHPKIGKAIETAVKQTKGGSGLKEVYELGVGISFLTEFDDPQATALARQMYLRMLELQKPDGSFRYTGDKGDTSVTQYAVLGMWSAKHANLVENYSYEPVERACNWLMRTQAPAGNWGYHGQDPGTYRRIPQTIEVSPTMFAGGAGSLYICADVLNFRKRAQKSDNPFTSVKQAKDKIGFPTTKAVNHQYLWDCLSLSDSYSRQLPVETEWQYYYWYAMERYYTFRATVNGIKEDPQGPGWYNNGVKLMMRTQNDDGSWQSKETNCPPIVDTALALLFLLRSTKEKVADATNGTLIGGNGIPKNFQNAMQTEDGQVVAPTESNAIEDLDALIRAMENKDFDASNLDLTQFKMKPTEQKSQLDLLREQVKHPDFNRRLGTVRVLSKGGLDNAPVLIYALSDPDNRVMVEARDSLRLMSRKLQGFGLPYNADAEQKKIAQRQWSQWLRSIRPDLEF